MTTTPTSGAADLPEALHRVIDDFERRERGLPQAHIAAALVTELRAALAAGQATAAQPAPATQQVGAPASIAGPMQFGGCPDCGSRNCVARECTRTVSHKAQAIPGVQWQCGPQASGFTAQAAESVPVLDERDDFEKVFPLPSGCIRVGTGYASTGYSNWAAHTHCERWQGWQARAARAPADSVLEDAARWQMVVLVGNEVMLHPEKRSYAAAVAAYMDAVHRGLDLTGAIDSARKQGGA